MTQDGSGDNVSRSSSTTNAPVAPTPERIPPSLHANNGNGSKDAAADSMPESKSDYSKKATLIFLASIGATLLLTGATGSRMLKSKAATSTATTAQTSHQATAAGSVASAIKGSSSSTHTTTRVVKSGPARRSSSRLRDLFQDTSGSAITALDFRANQHATWSPETSKAGGFLNSLRATDDDIPPRQAQEGEPHGAGDIVIDAAKAFSIATAITLGGAGAVIFLLAKHLEANDLPTFLERFRSKLMQPLSTALAESDIVLEFMRIPKPVETEESKEQDRTEQRELQALLDREWKDLLRETKELENHSQRSGNRIERA